MSTDSLCPRRYHRRCPRRSRRPSRQRSRRARRVSSCLVRRLLRREIAISYRNPYTEGSSAPTEAIGVGSLKANRPWRAVSAGAEAARHGRSACSCCWPFSLFSNIVCRFLRTFLSKHVQSLLCLAINGPVHQFLKMAPANCCGPQP